MIAFASHSMLARRDRSDELSDSNPVPYHSPIEYRLRVFACLLLAIRVAYQNAVQLANIQLNKRLAGLGSWRGILDFLPEKVCFQNLL